MQLTRMRLEDLTKLLCGHRSKINSSTLHAYMTIDCWAHGAVAHDVDGAPGEAFSRPEDLLYMQLTCTPLEELASLMCAHVNV